MISAARAIGAVAELAGAEGAEQLAKKAFGEADNPYMEVLFDAMQLRTFTYNFNLHQEVKKKHMKFKELYNYSDFTWHLS